MRPGSACRRSCHCPRSRRWRGEGREAGVAIEVWGHGRSPLAISGRCYHARLHDRGKDSCQFVCEDDPDGRDVQTLDGKSFLTVDGVQMLGHAHTTAAGQVAELTGVRVGALRLWPQTADFAAIVMFYDRIPQIPTGKVEALAGLRELMPGTGLANGFHAGVPGLRRAD